jgi:hypothetical protein
MGPPVKKLLKILLSKNKHLKNNQEEYKNCKSLALPSVSSSLRRFGVIFLYLIYKINIYG